LGDNGFDSVSVTESDDQRIRHPNEVDRHRLAASPAGRPFMGTLVMQMAVVANNDHRQHQ
jgi:hypothetical protein